MIYILSDEELKIDLKYHVCGEINMAELLLKRCTDFLHFFLFGEWRCVFICVLVVSCLVP